MPQSWEDLRRTARHVESEIDTKLVALNKINSSNGTSFSTDTSKTASKKAMLENLSSEIEALLNKLTSINTEMKDHLDTMDYGQEGKSALHHTYRRHREILRDYNTEFNRAHANITSQLEREDLLGSGGSSTEAGFALNNRTRSTELLLRENDRINSCDRLLDEQLGLASSVKENLYGQRSGLDDITKRLHQMTKKYPAINNIMQKIRMKKRKDTLILAGVIASCLIVFFLYIMH